MSGDNNSIPESAEPGVSASKSTKRKTFSPFSPELDSQPRSKFRFETSSEDISAILSEENIDLQKGIRLLINLQLESNNNANKMMERIDKLTSWIENIDDAMVDMESRIQEVENKLSNPPSSVRTEVLVNPLIGDLTRKITELEDRSRRNNIVIAGLEEIGSGTWEEVEEQVIELCRSKLSVTDISIERAHRIGRKNQNKPRPIVCKLLNYKDKERIKRNGYKLKGTNIFINDDFSNSTRTARYHLRAFMKDKKANGAASTRLNYDKLYIDNKTYIYNFETSSVVESLVFT